MTNVSPKSPSFDGLRLPLFHKLYDFYLVLYGYTKSFPKKDRYTLGVKLENLVLEMLELILLAITKQKPSRILILNKVSTKANLLKILIRLAKDVKAINLKQYLALEGRLQEIGKMTGGWLKDLKK